MINIEKLQMEIDGLSTQIVVQERKIKELFEENEHLNELKVLDKSQSRSPDRLDKSKRGDMFVSKAITSRKDKEEDSFLGNK
jgi:hypothetical protein